MQPIDLIIIAVIVAFSGFLIYRKIKYRKIAKECGDCNSCSGCFVVFQKFVENSKKADN